MKKSNRYLLAGAFFFAFDTAHATLVAAPDCVSGVAYTAVGAGSCSVPAGVTSMTIVVLGGGGGGAIRAGGAGATVTVSNYPVTATNTLSWVIGGGGVAGGLYGGGGGGGTEVSYASTPIIIAGGGGGGGSNGVGSVGSSTGTGGGTGGYGGSGSGGLGSGGGGGGSSLGGSGGSGGNDGGTGDNGGGGAGKGSNSGGSGGSGVTFNYIHWGVGGGGYGGGGGGGTNGGGGGGGYGGGSGGGFLGGGGGGGSLVPLGGTYAPGTNGGVAYDFYSFYALFNGGGGSVLLTFSSPTHQTPSVATSTGTGSVSAAIVSGSSGCGFDAANSLATTVNAAYNGSNNYPHGAYQWKLTGCNSGETVTVSVTFPSLAGLTLKKYGPTPSSGGQSVFYTPTNLVISGNTATYSVTDGALGDDDLTLNGSIIDPVVPVLASASDANSIPTLSEWGQMILGGLLAAGGVVFIRRRRMTV